MIVKVEYLHQIIFIFILCSIYETSGERLDGVDSEAAALKLRGRAGTSVTLKVHSVIFFARQFFTVAFGLLDSLSILCGCFHRQIS